jgi:phage protein D
MTTARSPKFKIKYEGKDITADLTPYLLHVEYEDKEQGESDELTITLEDTDALWRNEWFPTKGDKLDLDFGYDDFLVDAGTFTVDTIEFSGPPDTVVIKGVASWITSAMRTKVSKAYEGQTLKQIAEQVAAKHGLKVLGNILTLRIARSTQNRETDLGYLKRLAGEFGYHFSIKGDKLVFESIFDIDKGKPVVALSRQNLSRYQLTDTALHTYKQAKVSYHDPKTRGVIFGTVDDVQNGAGQEFKDETAEDVLEIRTKAEDKAQAELKAKAALYGAKSKQVAGNITVEGNPILVAGNNFELTNMGAMSGKYHIVKSRHRIDRSGGYVTELEVKRVGYVDKSKQKAPTTTPDPKYNVKIFQ